jgi:two-component system response regulator RegX3
VRILLLEDDPLQMELARTWLLGHGHRVHATTSGNDALKALERETFDLAIFDWMVPDIGGDELLRWLRQREQRMPVMFATARDEEMEVASILALGADDYVAKPLRRMEFLARVDALGRRAGVMEQPRNEVIEVPPWRLERESRTVLLHGRPVKMTPRMIDVAFLLFRRRGQLVPRAQLYEQVWGRRAELDTRTADTHVSRLRQALELDGRHGWKLSAVYQHGYRLEETFRGREEPSRSPGS